MIRNAIDRLLGKRRMRNSRSTAEVLRTIGTDESLLYKAICHNVNKNDRALCEDAQRFRT